MNYHETFAQMVERKKKEMETEPHIIYNLTKVDWAMILSLLEVSYPSVHSTEGEERWEAAQKLARQFNGAFINGAFEQE
jgi:hypothetical protein